MTPSSSSLPADRELLALARSVLSDEEYAVEEITAPLGLLLAENRYFVVGVIATPTIAQLLAAQPLAEAAMSERLAESDAGPKRWDGYLILLTQERSPENRQTTRELFGINYDTRSLRRIAHAGVEPTLAAVREALTPFVAPIELDDPSIAGDPFDALEESLAVRGVERDLAHRAIAAYKQGVPLADVL